MAVRKLAPEEVQPKGFAFSPENEAWADQQIAKYPPGRQASAVIALLWRAQEQSGGWLPQKAIEVVAVKLGMAFIRVMEVATFYSMFNLEPVGRHFVQLCGTTPCALRGANDLKKLLQRSVGEERYVSADGEFSWLEVECLGGCCNAPMVQINDDYYEDLTPESLEALLDDLAAGRPVKPGPQSGRHSSEPQGDVTTLTDPTLYDGSVIGAWRMRFEEEAVKAADTAEAASATAAAASNPKPAKPETGRAVETETADTPAKRAKEGERPIKASDRSGAADPSKATAAAHKAEETAALAPQSAKSYVATPSKPEADRAKSKSEGPPAAGAKPSKTGKPRGGRKGKPGAGGTDDASS